MDKEMLEAPAAPKVEAVPEDIQQEQPQSPQPPQPPQQQYPSPRVEDSEASFFQGDRQLDQHPGHQHAEPPTPPQRASRPDVNAEDLQLGGPGEDQIQQLQLAAQMSQAISGVVGGSSAEENDFESQEPNLQSLQQLQDQDDDMQGQDHGLPELPENIPPSMQQDLQDSLRNVMPHPDSQQEPQHPQHVQHAPHPQHASYMDHQQQPTHLAPAVPMGLDQAQYAVGDIPPRKRSKVSRACDECRRKKVKCDAVSETGEEACSNCRRSNVRCLFSRVPQKRGPSKGYIKELADRIHSIEGKLEGQTVSENLAGELATLPRRDVAEAYAISAAQADESRKRPFSHISSENFSTPSPGRQPAWPAEPRPAFSQQASYSANGLGLKPILPRERTNSTPSRPPNMDMGVDVGVDVGADVGAADVGADVGIHVDVDVDVIPQDSHAPQPNTVLLEIGDEAYHA